MPVIARPSVGRCELSTARTVVRIYLSQPLWDVRRVPNLQTNVFPSIFADSRTIYLGKNKRLGDIYESHEVLALTKWRKFILDVQQDQIRVQILG